MLKQNNVAFCISISISIQPVGAAVCAVCAGWTKAQHCNIYIP